VSKEEEKLLIAMDAILMQDMDEYTVGANA
jgi:hypothetical protein